MSNYEIVNENDAIELFLRDLMRETSNCNE